MPPINVRKLSEQEPSPHSDINTPLWIFTCSGLWNGAPVLTVRKGVFLWCSLPRSTRSALLTLFCLPLVSSTGGIKESDVQKDIVFKSFNLHFLIENIVFMIHTHRIVVRRKSDENMKRQLLKLKHYKFLCCCFHCCYFMSGLRKLRDCWQNDIIQEFAVSVYISRFYGYKQ